MSLVNKNEKKLKKLQHQASDFFHKLENVILLFK